MDILCVVVIHCVSYKCIDHVLWIYFILWIHRAGSQLKNLTIQEIDNKQHHVIMLCRSNIATWPKYMGIGRDA